MELNKIYCGDSLEVLKTFPDKSINCCVTSPPYWGLRDYGVVGQLGLEPTPEEYVNRMVEIFREAKRVLRDDGTLWLNLGDSYAGGGFGGHPDNKAAKGIAGKPVNKVPNLKPKDLVGIPWRVAFALQADGWYLRSDIIWSKPNAMPESVKDRPTKAHEYIFLLSKSEKYYYDADAIKEPAKWERWGDQTVIKEQQGTAKWIKNKSKDELQQMKFKNKRTVWQTPTRPFKGAHFAVFPPELIKPCILAGCPKDGIVLDPFMGSGTTAIVAKQNARNYVGIELNEQYAREIAEPRLNSFLF